MKRYILILISIVYLISPIDFIPDFFLPFGIADDLVVLLFLVKEIIGLIRSRKMNVALNKFPFENPNFVEGEIIE